MRISRIQFTLITIMFLLLPLSSSWKLLLFGEKTKGTVVKHAIDMSNAFSSGGNISKHCIIRFETDDKYIEFASPGEIMYPVGRQITIFYNPKNPHKFLMFNFEGLFLTPKMILPGILLMLWLAFYFSFNQPKRKVSPRSNMEKYWNNIKDL